MLIHLTSERTDSTNTLNTWKDFSCALPSSYTLDRRDKYAIALVNYCFYIKTGDPIDIKRWKNHSRGAVSFPIQITCDVVETGAHNNREIKLLAVTRLKDCVNKCFSPNNLIYTAIGCERLTNIRIRIQDSRGYELPDYDYGASSILLNTRKFST